VTYNKAEAKQNRKSQEPITSWSPSKLAAFRARRELIASQKSVLEIAASQTG